MKQAKTNAMRLLEQQSVPYTPHEYDTKDGAIDGVSVAQKTGQNPQCVFKTLVTHAENRYFVFCIPVAEELDLKAAARAAGEKSIAMLPLAEITKVTGYMRGGCSPLGMKKQYPVFIDASAQTLAKVVVSGGKIGLQIELEPNQLAAVAGASFALLTK